MAAPSDSVILTSTDLPVYPTGSMIRYYPSETKDEHYTVLQLKTGEVLQLKSPNQMVRTQLKFASFAAWYETLSGSPDAAAFKVQLGKESVFVSPKTAHLESLPDYDKNLNSGDIYKWNRMIVRLISELTPELLQNPSFVDNYNTLTKLLKRYETNLMMVYDYMDRYNPDYILKLIPAPNYGRSSYWFQHLPLTWCDEYRDGPAWYKSSASREPSISNEEKAEVRRQITESLQRCIDAVKPTLYEPLAAVYRYSRAKYELSICKRSLKVNDRAMKKIEDRRKYLEEMANKYARIVIDYEKSHST
jgi:hypothetical protein